MERLAVGQLARPALAGAGTVREDFRTPIFRELGRAYEARAKTAAIWPPFDVLE
ncbi:hypothetical protein [Sphingomonas sp. MS122]|uniref:hypothetical protein n=1 Tax=Sphingomonas sp. MS122 TaxID=3412683 RepID=UPI003C2C87A5